MNALDLWGKCGLLGNTTLTDCEGNEQSGSKRISRLLAMSSLTTQAGSTETPRDDKVMERMAVEELDSN
ncbi:hypothetical protein D3C85_1686690 [compost metagenome]